MGVVFTDEALCEEFDSQCCKTKRNNVTVCGGHRGPGSVRVLRKPLLHKQTHLTYDN